MWQTAISILSAGYIAMQIPSTLYMAKTKRPSIFIVGCILVGNRLLANSSCSHVV